MLNFPYLRLDPDIVSIADLGTAANKMLYTTAINTWAEADITAAGRAILDDATAAIQATTLGLGTANSVQHASLKVGTANLKAGALFELAEDAANAEAVLSCFHNTEATTALLTLRKADGTEAAPALVDDNAVLGTVHFDGYDGSGWHTGAKIEVRVNGDPSDGTDMPAEISFWTTPNASATPLQRVTILADGSVGIGTTSPIYNLEVVNSGGALVNVMSVFNNRNTLNDISGVIFRDNFRQRAAIRMRNDSEGNDSGSLIFYTGSGDDTGDGGDMRMVIDSSGFIGIGTVAAPTSVLSIGDSTEGGTASLNIQTAHETHTLAGAGTSDTTTISIPTGAKILGASFCVNTAVSDDGGNDTWSAAFITGNTQTLATAAAAAQNTKVNTLIDPNTATVIASNTTQIRFTANGGSFDGGVIEIVAYYIDLTSLANV